ncbi:MAG: AraC family transcriptional regulator [Fimbriimonadaceae bacterium]|nr:AraC family transcriptional regulator [Fimbriimonadaceae bacterium]
MHRHDFTEVFLVLEGTCEHDLMSRQEILRRGDLRMISPDHSHRFTLAKSEPFRMVNVAITQETTKSLKSLLPESSVFSPLHEEGTILSHHFGGKDLLHLRRLFEECLAHVDQRNNGRHLLSLFAALDESVASLPAIVAPAWLQNAIDAVRTPQGLLEGIGAMRRAAQVTDAHLARSVQKIYQTTPSSLVARIRVEAAMELLRKTDLTVEEICRRVGFGTAGDFHRRFASLTGLTPAEFRQKALRTVAL